MSVFATLFFSFVLLPGRKRTICTKFEASWRVIHTKLFDSTVVMEVLVQPINETGLTTSQQFRLDQEKAQYRFIGWSWKLMPMSNARVTSGRNTINRITVTSMIHCSWHIYRQVGGDREKNEVEWTGKIKARKVEFQAENEACKAVLWPTPRSV